MGLSEDRRITILSASETGNSRGVADDFYERIKEFHDNVRVVDAMDYSVNDLPNEDILVMVTSTQGFGEPPYEAEDYYADVMSAEAPSISTVIFAVLGLGDSVYGDDYNTMVRHFDKRYAELGGRRLIEHGECDLDYEETAEQWGDILIDALKEELGGEGDGQKATPDSNSQGDKGTVEPAQQSNGSIDKKYFIGHIANREYLSSPSSSKHVIKVHIETSDDLPYVNGDMVAMSYVNNQRHLDRILSHVSHGVDDATYQTLINERDITKMSGKLIARYAQASGNAALAAKAEDAQWVSRYCASHPVDAFVAEYPFIFTDSELLDIFAVSARRLYSISNDPVVEPHAIDLTMRVIEYPWDGDIRQGGCTGYLANSPLGTEVRFSIISHDRFHMPEDESTPLIMVGLGSAVASYRAFLQHRETVLLAGGAPGPMWLFTGYQRPDHDFLYEDEIQHYLGSNILTRFDPAWSRVDRNREHVQDVFIRNGKEILNWINKGAVIYMCGHSQEILESLERSLADALIRGGGITEDKAHSLIAQLNEDRRICR